MSSRIAQSNITTRGASPASFTFNGGACDAAIVKVRQASVNTINSVTYGGQTMLLLVRYADVSNVEHQIYGLQNAPQGSVTVTIISSNPAAIIASAESYDGISGSATFPNITNTGEVSFPSPDTLTVDVATTVPDCILVGLGGYVGSNISDVFAGADTTQISNYDPATGTSDVSVESNPLDVGVAGTYHLQVKSGATNQNLTLIVAALAPGTRVSTFIPQMIII